MKVLVVGASGLVGWNLLEAARSGGHDVLGTCSSHAMPGLVQLQIEDEKGRKQLLAKFCPDVAFCCIGWTWVDGCESDPARAFRENTEYPARLAASAVEIGSRFVYFSTSYVFDGKEGPYTEEAETNPLSVYGHSKLEGEREVLEATAGDALVARTMGVYGPEPQQKNFVYQVRKALSGGQSFRVPEDQFGNVTYAPDLARMAIALAGQGQRGIWNLAGPDPSVRRSDFARLIAQNYGLREELLIPIKTNLLHQPAQRPVQGGLIIEKAVRATSITPHAWVQMP